MGPKIIVYILESLLIIVTHFLAEKIEAFKNRDGFLFRDFYPYL